MESESLKYIFENSKSKKMNIYKSIPTLNTMKQYLNLTRKMGFNHEEDQGNNNQKAVILKRIDGAIIGELKNSKYPSNSRESMTITKSKLLTEKLLRDSNINTTNSKLYSGEECQKAKEEFFNDNHSVKAVIKPVDMSQGKGVNVGVTFNDFEYYWKNTVSEMKRFGKRDIEVLVQEYVEGFEARAVVIEGKLISIVARVPAHVVGNGINSIEKLVEIKNKQRKKCAHLGKKLIDFNSKMQRYILDAGYSSTYIPKKGEYILLTSVSNTSLGGDMVDITDDVTDETKELAVKSIAAVPGLFSGGVDIMMKDFNDTAPVTIEINAWPMLQSTIYPTYGKPKDPQKYFLESFYARDQYFNQPKQLYNIEDSEEYLKTYFNFLQIKCDLHKNQLFKSYTK